MCRKTRCPPHILMWLGQINKYLAFHVLSRLQTLMIISKNRGRVPPVEMLFLGCIMAADNYSVIKGNHNLQIKDKSAVKFLTTPSYVIFMKISWEINEFGMFFIYQFIPSYLTIQILLLIRFLYPTSIISNDGFGTVQSVLAGFIMKYSHEIGHIMKRSNLRFGHDILIISAYREIMNLS